MTNSSPQEPQTSIPERRKRPATGVTFDEMIGIIIAFTTIGAVLFWSLGAKKGGIAGRFGSGEGSSFLSGSNTTATGFGFGSNQSDLETSLSKSDERKLAAQLRESESPVAIVPPSQELNSSRQAKQKSYQLDSGAKLVPLAGGAAASATLRNNRNANNNLSNANIGSVAAPKPAAKPKASTPKPAGKEKAKPKASTPKPVKKAKTKPKSAPKKPKQVPKDIAPDYWAYPFVKQMSDKALVPDFADNQNFEPDKLITRAGMATLISQAFDQEPANEQTKQFKDVSDKNAITADIDKAVRTGFMQGYSENTFRPLENIPRYQVLVTLATGLGLKPSGDAEQILQKFGDGTDMPDWAKQQVAAATEAGLIVNPPGMSQNSLMPNKSATRGEVAAMIHQSLVKSGKLQPLESEFVIKK